MLLAAALVGGPAAMAAPAPEFQVIAPAPGLRGPQARAAPPAQAPAGAFRDYQDEPRVTGFDARAAPRMSGLGARSAGGGQCRQTCAQAYYFCLSGQYADDCGQSWGQCLRGCPSVTSDRY